MQIWKKEDFLAYDVALFDQESFLGWGQYLRIAIPTTILGCVEWWAFEFIVIFAGTIGVEYLQAQVAVININYCIFMLSMGLQFTASGLVGQTLAPNQRQAKRFALCCVILAVSLISILAILINIFDRDLARIFTQDEAVIEIVCQLIPYLAVFVLLDAVHGVQAGNVRALGRQKPVTYMTILCYYVIGMPLAVYLGFYCGMDLEGFWLGFIIAMCLVDFVVVYLVVTSSWRAEQVMETQTEAGREAAMRKNSMALSRQGKSLGSS